MTIYQSVSIQDLHFPSIKHTLLKPIELPKYFEASKKDFKGFSYKNEYSPIEVADSKKEDTALKVFSITEIAMNILSYLDYESLKNFRLCCQELNFLCCQEKTWKRLLISTGLGELRWPDWYTTIIEKNGRMNCRLWGHFIEIEVLYDELCHQKFSICPSRVIAQHLSLSMEGKINSLHSTRNAKVCPPNLYSSAKEEDESISVNILSISDKVKALKKELADDASNIFKGAISTNQVYPLLSLVTGINSGMSLFGVASEEVSLFKTALDINHIGLMQVLYYQQSLQLPLNSLPKEVEAELHNGNFQKFDSYITAQLENIVGIKKSFQHLNKQSFHNLSLENSIDYISHIDNIHVIEALSEKIKNRKVKYNLNSITEEKVIKYAPKHISGNACKKLMLADNNEDASYRTNNNSRLYCTVIRTSRPSNSKNSFCLIS